MAVGLHLVLPVCLVGAVFIWTSSTGVFIPNLTEACYRCLCFVSTLCTISNGCAGGYCGPFNISKVYWVDAGKATLPDDDPERNRGLVQGSCGSRSDRKMQDETYKSDEFIDPSLSAWEDCARNYQCSKRIIEGYLQKFGKDCNGDGVTNCYDYMMINGNGGYGCTAPLNRSVNGRRWLQRYEECRHSL